MQNEARKNVITSLQERRQIHNWTYWGVASACLRNRHRSARRGRREGRRSGELAKRGRQSGRVQRTGPGWVQDPGALADLDRYVRQSDWIGLNLKASGRRRLGLKKKGNLIFHLLDYNWWALVQNQEAIEAIIRVYHVSTSSLRKWYCMTPFFRQIGQFLNFRNEIYKTWGFQQCIAWSTKVPKNMSTCCLFHEKMANFE